MIILNILLKNIFTEQDTLEELINRPINIFLSKVQYRHLALIKKHKFEVINHYLDSKSLYYQNIFWINENASNYELKINNSKVCVNDDLLRMCLDSEKATRFNILRTSISGYLIKNNDKCLTVTYDSSVRFENCLEDADEQIFDFRPVKKLKCDKRYKYKYRKDDESESNNKEEEKYIKPIIAPIEVITTAKEVTTPIAIEVTTTIQKRDIAKYFIIESNSTESLKESLKESKKEILLLRNNKNQKKVDNDNDEYFIINS